MKTNVAFVFFFILGLTYQVAAQYDLLYENHQQDLGNVPRAVADDGQGNTWMAGNFTESLTLGTITLTNIENPGQYLGTGFIGKFNSGSNSWLWAKKITLVSNGSGYQTHTNYAIIWDMARDNAGNVYITGQYSGVVSFDNISLSSTKNGKQHTPDIFIAKYNANGGIVWAKSLGTKTGSDKGYTIALDDSGNIFVGGTFTNKIISCSNGPTEIYDVYLAKLTNAGTTLWQKRYASTNLICYSSNAANDLSVDASGNVYMVGQFSGTVSFGSGSGLSISSVNGTVDAFAAKINSSGTAQWVKATGGTGYDHGNAIHVDASGNVYAGGGVAPNTFLHKYSTNGNLLWSINPYPGSSNAIKSINPYGNSILVNNSLVGFKTISPSDGSLMISDSLIGNAVPGPHYNIMDTEIAGSGFVFAVLSRCGEVTIGGTTLTSSNSCPINGGDFFLVRNTLEGTPPAFQAGNGIDYSSAGINDVSKREIVVYPNPARDQLHITLPERENETTVFIQNQYGRTIWSEIVDSQTTTTTIPLDGQHFQSGMYYLICLSSGNVKTMQFIIEK